MKLFVTGTPGTGKTVVSRALGRYYRLERINEKEFALKQRIGKWSFKENELEINTAELGRALNRKLFFRKKDIIAEGHLLCETKLKVDFVILLRADPKRLEKILLKRGYRPLKVYDNVFAEETGYCKKQLEKRYPRRKIIEVYAGANVKETMSKIIKELDKKLINVSKVKK